MSPSADFGLTFLAYYWLREHRHRFAANAVGALVVIEFLVRAYFFGRDYGWW